MIELLLQPEVQKFILQHELDDEKKLILQNREIQGVPLPVIADQIVGRRKAKTKLPLYYNTHNIVYPPGLNLEQSSSEKTAEFKARIAGENKTLVDLTGGFGIDSFFMSKWAKKIIYVEPNTSLAEIASHNHRLLGSSNIEYVHASAEAFLNSFSGKVDFMYCDPSRRTECNQKVFRFSDCEPNMVDLIPLAFEKSTSLLIKSSPLLDIHQGVKELKHVEKVWVVSVDNECKELLFLCEKDFPDEPIIVAINLTHQQEEGFSFTFEDEKKSVSTFSKPLNYLYEPNASILKGGAFKLVGEKYSVSKLHPSTHLYTSEKLNEKFPGRIFKITQFVKPDPKKLKEIFPEGKANVFTRNYPLTPAELKKKTKLKDGGENFLIGFSGQTEKYLVAAERIH